MRPLLLGLLFSSATAIADAPAPVPARPDEGAHAPASAPAPAPAPPRGNGLSQVVVDDLPAACQDLGKLADSPSANQALSARISLASCVVEQRLKPIVLCDCEQSVRDIEAASTQSLTLLEEVVQIGDATTKILALQAQGDLLAGFAIRILATVPPPVDATEAAVTLRDMRLSLIQPHVGPWQQRARSAYQQLETIARANPQLAKNSAVAAAVRASRTKLTQSPGVAKR